MFPCGGSSVELLWRLHKRLDEAKKEIIPEDAPSDAAGSSGEDDIRKKIKETYEEIKENMEKLKKELCLGKRKDDKVLDHFQIVARNIDEILTRARRARDEMKKSGSEKSSLRDEIIKSSLQMLSDIKIEIKDATELQLGIKDEKEAEEEAAEEKEEDPEFPLERKIQESSAWTHLKLVVDSFENQLKRCLFCLTVFPPNAVIKRRLLFHWWMGEGIINTTLQGKKCFNKLVERGFVIPIAERHCDKPHYCKIQTWIRRLLIAVAKSNAFLEYDSSSFPNVDYSRSRRACLRLRMPIPQDVIGDDEANRRLLTIYNVSMRYIDLADEWFVNKEDLTTMQLGRWKEQDEEVVKHHIEVKSYKFLERMGNCRHLKYVSLRGVSRIEKLPDQFEKLTKLVVLDLRACHNLEELPKSVGYATKLQYLDISECYLLDKIPKNLSNLSELQVFKGFVVGDFANKSLLQVADLGNLTKLRKLNISTGREFKNEELSSLYKLKNLTCLTIIWAVIQWKEKENEPEKEQKRSGAPPEKETTEKPMDDDDANGAQSVPTQADDKKPSASRVIPSMAAEEKKSDQVSSLEDKVPSELPRAKKKVQLSVPETEEKAVEKPPTITRQNTYFPSSKRLGTTMSRKINPDDVPSDVIPQSVKKLDLQCYDKKNFPAWIAPEKLPNLEKLYIRGGKLVSLGHAREPGGALHPGVTKWKVKMLRLRFLDDLQDNWSELETSFPNIDCVELFKCKMLESWHCEKQEDEDNPGDERRYWFKKKDTGTEGRGD